MIFSSATIIINLYFDKRRALANGIVSSGAGVGMFLFSILGRYLLDHYTWKGKMLIEAAIALNMIPCAMVFRPIQMTEEFHAAEIDIAERDILASEPEHHHVSKPNLGRHGTPIAFGQSHSEQIRFNLNPRRSIGNSQGRQGHNKDTRSFSVPKLLHDSLKVIYKPEPVCYSAYHVNSTLHSALNSTLNTSRRNTSPFLKPLDRQDIFYSGSMKRLSIVNPHQITGFNSDSMKRLSIVNPHQISDLGTVTERPSIVNPHQITGNLGTVTEEVNDLEESVNSKHKVRDVFRTMNKVMGLELMANPVFGLIIFFYILSMGKTLKHIFVIFKCF